MMVNGGEWWSMIGKTVRVENGCLLCVLIMLVKADNGQYWLPIDGYKELDNDNNE